MKDARATEVLLTRTGARRLLGCGWDVVQALVERGFVKTVLQHGYPVAPKSAWINGFAAYMEHRPLPNPPQRVLPSASKSGRRLTHPTVMSVGVYTGLRLQYGSAPRCYVCGKPLGVGALWRWFVPAADQAVPLLDVEPAFGCAKGHEGVVIEVAGRWFRIAPPGERPEQLTDGESQYHVV